MKFNIISIIMIIMLGTSVSQAQDKKIEEVSFQVDGVCKMCKTRIEEAALYTKGVKFAEWNKETKILKVAYQTKKVDEATVHKSIADAGHDTSKTKAPEEAYAKLPGCCKYRDGVQTH